LAVVAGVGVLGALPAAGQTPAGPRDASPAQRAPQPGVEGLERGAQWTNQGQAYAVVPQVRAVMGRGQGEEPSAALARLGVTGGQVMERKGGYIVYKQAAPPRPAGGAATPAPLVAAKGDPRPVALNLRTNRLAVVLNTVRVELADATAAQALAADLGITLGRQMPSRPVAYYTAPAGADLVLLLNRMRADPRVAAADLELIEFARALR
jgi:hypothetical protein